MLTALLIHSSLNNYSTEISHILNLWKGGDFMERGQDDPVRHAAIDAAREVMANPIVKARMAASEWEGPALAGLVEDGSNPTSHPLRKGIIRPLPESGVAEEQI